MKIRAGYEGFKKDLIDQFRFLLIEGWEIEQFYEKSTIFRVNYNNKNRVFLVKLSAEYVGMALNFGVSKSRKFHPFWKIFKELEIPFDNHGVYVNDADYMDKLKTYASTIEKNWYEIESYCQQNL